VPRDVVALVSADDFVSAIRVYADRVNDLLRRRGIPPLEAVEVLETHALAMLDAVVNAPETVIDLAGWWFARAVETTTAARRRTAAGQDETTSVLAGTESEARVRAALASLDDPQRDAVILRDAYDLPPQAVGVALRRSADTATELTARGRLALVEIYDDRRAPSLAGHTGRTTVDVLSLSRLADDSLDSPRAAPLRRHVANCAACEEMLETLARGRRLGAGLPIIAMDDDAREALIERIAEHATVALPSHDAVLRAVDEDHDPRSAVSPVIATIAVILAIALGVAVGAISRAGHSLGPLAATPPPTTVPVTPSFSVSPSPTRTRTASPTPTPSLTVEPTLPVTPLFPPTTEAPPPTHAKLLLSPTLGRSGTNILVNGSGWTPGVRVYVSYAGQPQTSRVARADGTFSTYVVANSVLPGNRRVTATNGDQSATATFTQQL
jgi:DNA-directed RNA polymerase specialized sigma24 family protein